MTATVSFDVADGMRIALVGGGKMGEAIMGGWIGAHEAPADVLGPENFVVANPGGERRSFLQERYGVACVDDARRIGPADLVLLAVKPQVMMGVLKGIAEEDAYAGGPDGPLFVSIAAGLSTARLEAALPPGARLVRTMPNTPLLVGAGVTAVTGGAHAAPDDVALVRDLFACLGTACVVDEADIDAVGALSGSGPAYVAAFVEALRDAGAALGLDAALAERLAFETVRGTIELHGAHGPGRRDHARGRVQPGRLHTCGACRHGRGRVRARHRRRAVRRRTPIEGVGPVLRYLIVSLVDVYSMLIFVYVIMSWLPTDRGILRDVNAVLAKVCDPYLNLFKKLIPPLGGMVDITPIIALLVLQLGAQLLVRFL